MKIFTIGHSNRSLDEFLLALDAFRIEALADVRRRPISRVHPQFDGDNLERALSGEGFDYVWLGRGLGGFRSSPEARSLSHSSGRETSGYRSPNEGWEEEGFRNYADYALTREFDHALAGLEALAKRKTTACMCAERDYTNCHRQIISDHLVARGWEVIHIIDAARSMAHRMTPFVRVEDSRVTYPARFTDSRLDAFF